MNGLSVLSLGWGEAVVTILHRWKVVLLLPPWLPTNRIMEVFRAGIKSKDSAHNWKGAQVPSHPPPTTPTPRVFPRIPV